MMRSSAKRDRCTRCSEAANRYSATKSRSDTAGGGGGQLALFAAGLGARGQQTHASDLHPVQNCTPARLHLAHRGGGNNQKHCRWHVTLPAHPPASMELGHTRPSKPSS